MAYTAAQLSALEDAIATGALKVRYSDKEVTYQSLAEMESLRVRMQREIRMAAGTASARPRHRLADFRDD